MHFLLVVTHVVDHYDSTGKMSQLTSLLSSSYLIHIQHKVKEDLLPVFPRDVSGFLALILDFDEK